MGIDKQCICYQCRCVGLTTKEPLAYTSWQNKSSAPRLRSSVTTNLAEKHKTVQIEHNTVFFIIFCNLYIFLYRMLLCTPYGSTRQPSIKYVLANRANELSSDRICGIIQRGCSNNPNVIDFKIDIDREPALKVNGIA